MSYGMNGEAKQVIFGLKSKLGRANERITVLEGLVQSISDDRDGYLERAVELEQVLSAVDGALTGLRLKYEARDRDELTGESISALDAVNACVAAFAKVTADDSKKESVA
jgi:hypothetical protein